jgi:tRNA-2-methylthio-N6-dimethylallyladenosine synthase
VLVEGPSKRAAVASAGLQLTGRTMTDHIVVFDGSPRLIGHTVRVGIVDASPFTLYGEVELASGGRQLLEDGQKLGGLTPPVRPTKFSLPLV